MLAHQSVSPINDQHQGLARLQGLGSLGQQPLLQLPHQSPVCGGEGPGSARDGDAGMASCSINRGGVIGKMHTGRYGGGHPALALGYVDRHRGV